MPALSHYATAARYKPARKRALNGGYGGHGVVVPRRRRGIGRALMFSLRDLGRFARSERARAHSPRRTYTLPKRVPKAEGLPEPPLQRLSALDLPPFKARLR